MSYKVLVVEDEDIIRRGIVCSVNWHGLGCGSVDEARDGQEALERIRTGGYDIVLMDINMPVYSGLDVLEQTCQEFGYVAIMITGYSDFDFAQRALRYGTVDYLLKPVDMAELEQAVIRACTERERRLTYARVREGDLLSRQGQAQSLLPVRTAEEDANQVVDQMLAYIEGHFSEKITLAILSQALFYSESFMTRRFKAEMGINFADYLNRYRIQCALSMLRHSNMRLSDISAACGFSDYKYFNTVFKKYVGCSARQFVKEITKTPGRGSSPH